LIGLENTGSKITIISIDLKTNVKQYLDQNSHIQYELREVKEKDLENRDLIFLATSDSATNEYFRSVAKKLKIWVNSVDDPNHCDFFSASVVDLGPVQFSISSDGKFAGLSSTLRKLFEETIPKTDTDLFEKIFEMRKNLKTILPDINTRREVIKKIVQDLDSTYFHKSK
jgi:precorrin-2 dehydrogenase/sirohydrochlorin ferrochelatase